MPMVLGSWKNVLVGILVILGIALIYQETRASQVFQSKYRYSLVVGSERGMVSYVSFDPEEKRILIIPLPPDLKIRSRSVGEYSVSSLYKLGEYDGNPGGFIRTKVQGFMKVPIAGYLLVSEIEEQGTKKALLSGLLKSLIFSKNRTSMSRLDALTLLFASQKYDYKEVDREELVRSGAIVKEGNGYIYREERLGEFLKTQVFDWAVGEENVTVAIFNASGENGLGSDIAEFFTNMGFDVISVRGVENGEPLEDTTKIRIAESDIETHRDVLRQVSGLFDWWEIEIAETEEYRADLVIFLGKDATNLF